MSATLHPPVHALAASQTQSRAWSRPLLRTTSIIYVLFTLGHTMGGMLGDNRRGPRQAELFAAMRNYTFDVQGFTRSYWDFYRGFGFMTSVLLAFAAVLCWMLADMSRTHPAQARRILIALLGAMAATTWFSFADFFAGPMTFSMLATALLAVSVVTLGRDARRSTNLESAR